MKKPKNIKRNRGYPNAIEEYQSFMKVQPSQSSMLPGYRAATGDAYAQGSREKSTHLPCKVTSLDAEMAVSCDLNAVQVAYELTINHRSDLDL